MSVTAIRLEMDTEQMQKIFGMQDAYIKKLEQDFQVTIVDRNGSVMITGEEENVSKASRVLRQLTALSDHGNEIEEQSVDYAIEMGKEDQEENKIKRNDENKNRVDSNPVFIYNADITMLCERVNI